MPAKSIRTDEERLRDILDACALVSKYIQKILDEEETPNLEAYQFTVLHQLMIIGEAVGRVSEETKLRNPQVTWNAISNFRNVVVHDYFGVDWNLAWVTATDRVPELANEVEAILQRKFES